jgi:hypothetical protein
MNRDRAGGADPGYDHEYAVLDYGYEGGNVSEQSQRYFHVHDRDVNRHGCGDGHELLVDVRDGVHGVLSAGVLVRRSLRAGRVEIGLLELPEK